MRVGADLHQKVSQVRALLHSQLGKLLESSTADAHALAECFQHSSTCCRIHQVLHLQRHSIRIIDTVLPVTSCKPVWIV